MVDLKFLFISMMHLVVRAVGSNSTHHTRTLCYTENVNHEIYPSISNISFCKGGTAVDLTLAAQKASIYDQPDPRFFWNRMLFLPYVR